MEAGKLSTSGLRQVEEQRSRVYSYAVQLLYIIVRENEIGASSLRHPQGG